MLGSDERNARVHQRLLRVEHVERGTLAGLGFFAHPVQRDLGGRDLRLRGLHLRLAGLQLPPRLHNGGAGLVARPAQLPLPRSQLPRLCRGHRFGHRRQLAREWFTQERLVC